LFNGRAEDTHTIENLPVLQRHISVTESAKTASLRNVGSGAAGSGALQWRVMFAGKHPFIIVDGVRRKASQTVVKGSRTVSYLDVPVAANVQITARVE